MTGPPGNGATPDVDETSEAAGTTDRDSHTGNPQNKPPEADTQARLRQLLRALDPVTLVAFKPDADPSFRGAKTFQMSDPAQREAMGAWAGEHTKRGHNVYYHLNTGAKPDAKQAAKDITGFNGVAADVDAKAGRTLEQALADIEALPLPPTLTVMTGGGYQPLWLFRERLQATPEITERVRVVGVSLKERLHGDAIQNPDRILRFPLTKNFPNAKKVAARGPAIVEARIEGGSGRTYSLDELEAAFPPVQANVPDRNVRPAGGDALQRLGDPPRHITALGASLHNAALTALKLDKDEIASAARFRPERYQDRDVWRDMGFALMSEAAHFPTEAGWLEDLFIEVSAHPDATAPGVTFDEAKERAFWARELKRTIGKIAKGGEVKGVGSLRYEAEQAGWSYTPAPAAGGSGGLGGGSGGSGGRKGFGGGPAASSGPEDGEFVTVFDPWETFRVPVFPFDVLPPIVVDYATYLATTTGGDPAGCAMAALTACGGAMDQETTLRMMRTGDWLVRPLIWTLMVGDPGTVKSPVIAAATRQLQRLESAEVRQHSIALALWKVADKPTRGPEPPPPIRYLARDVTSEKLADLLVTQNRGILYVNDEMSGWLGQMEKVGKGGGSADRALWNKAHNGGQHTVDRIARGSIRIDNLAVPILGGIQPNRLPEVAKLTSDGLLQRFLPVILQRPRRTEEAATNDPAKAFDALIETLANLPPMDFTLDAAARLAAEEFQAFAFEVSEARAHGEHFVSWMNKLRGLHGSLALILHVAGKPGFKVNAQITEDTVRKATRLMHDFLIPHGMAFFGALGDGEDREDIRAICSYVLTADRDRFRPSDFTNGVRALSSSGSRDLVERLSRLVALGWLVEETRGPVVRAWTVAPGLREALAHRMEQERKRKREAVRLLGWSGK